MVDLYSRRIVGWSMQSSMTSQLVADALMMAVWRRGKPAELLHHSDQGSQYTSEHFQELLKEQGITCSMSRAGEVWDNSAMESFFSSLKTERTARKVYRTGTGSCRRVRLHRAVLQPDATPFCAVDDIGRLTPLHRLYPLPVRQASALPSASFRFRIAPDTLAVRLTLPPAGCVRDFHPQVIQLATTASRTAPVTALRAMPGAQQRQGDRSRPVHCGVADDALGAAPATNHREREKTYCDQSNGLRFRNRLISCHHV